jgi:group I intron endonuclease
MIIYKVLNKINGKIYIGQDSKDRPKYLGSGQLIKKALRKYGKENFVKETIGYCDDKEELNFAEKFYIDFFKSKVPNGYNITDGGEGVLGYHPTEEGRDRISKAMVGRPHSEEHRIKIAEANKHRHHSEETKKLIGSYHKGKIISEEMRNSISKKLTGSKHPWMAEINRKNSGENHWTKKRTNGKI